MLKDGKYDNWNTFQVVVDLLTFIVSVASAVAQSVERATPGQEIPGSIPAVGRPLPTGWVGVSIM